MKKSRFSEQQMVKILRVRPDLTAVDAIELILGTDQFASATELARYPNFLRKAGLP